MKPLALLRGLGAAFLVSSLVLPASAQTAPNRLGATPACGNAAPDEDSRSPESLVLALYQIVSGPAGAPKDWARMARLFAPGALVTPTLHGSGFLAAPQRPDQFAELNDRVFGQRAFYERELAQRIERYGHIAHVWSSFDTRDGLDMAPRARGVNSFQLMDDGKRWCILSATWDIETPDHPLPPQFEGASGR
ncbi:hypothetical protein [Massilia sp. GCM10023247]|uniref:hypothetical protein n=1 Tax=Massilia sp. GCM10023247 TaxID=3252643 RepID=UPI00361838E3